MDNIKEHDDRESHDPEKEGLDSGAGTVIVQLDGRDGDPNLREENQGIANKSEPRPLNANS